MRRELLMAEVARTAWAIEPGYGQRVLEVLARWSCGEQATDDERRQATATGQARGSRQRSAGGSIAVLPLYGTIAPKANLMSEFSGGTSCRAFSALLQEAVADSSVSQILIDIDSPGGSVHGLQELATEIWQARTQKPVIGIANHVAASAAYWLGCCCSELYVTPSGEVGSVGVWTAHRDISQALDKEGVRYTLVSAGKYKVEGNPYTALDNEAREFMQSTVNEVYRQFVAAVARGRGVSVERVRAGFGEGRMLLADAALREGMVDGIKDFSSLVHDLQAKPRTARGGRPSAAATAFSTAEARRAAAHLQREIDILSLS